MKYELLMGSEKGVLIDRTPIMLDIRDTFEVSFLLPQKGAYIALFRGEDNIEYKSVIKGGRVKLPPELLNKEQYVSLIVTEVNDEIVVHAWVCEPLKVTAYFHLRQNQWQVSGGMTDKSAFERIAEIEKQIAQANIVFTETQTLVMTDKSKREKTEKDLWLEFNRVLGDFDKHKSAQNAQMTELKKENERLINAYNKAIGVINNLSERITAIEKNYDPTLV
jgi:hypothetical protein|nr:MAG TPA: hypothetical protein [Caudoviricetes sp.]